MKKLKSKKLILNKIQISKIYNLSHINGGSVAQNVVTFRRDCYNETAEGDCNNQSISDCTGSGSGASAGYCTQETLTTGEVTNNNFALGKTSG